MGIQDYIRYANAYGEPSHKMRDHTYKPVGFCIYCLDQDISDGDLTLEHIITNALSGTLRLPKSSCRQCAEFGNKTFEQTALNTHFLVARRILNLRAQGKKTTRPMPKVALGDYDILKPAPGSYDTDLSAEDYPKSLLFFVFSRPGLITGIDSSGGVKALRLSIVNVAKKGAPVSRFPKIGQELLCKFDSLGLALAKIAYSFAVAERGVDGFDGDGIRKLLRCERNDIFNFVGSPEKTERRKYQDLHRLTLEIENGFLVVRIHLFASYAARPYEVVVGKLLKL